MQMKLDVQQAALQACLEGLRQEADRFNSTQSRAAALLAADGIIIGLIPFLLAALNGWARILPIAAAMVLLASAFALIICIQPRRSPTIPLKSMLSDEFATHEAPTWALAATIERVVTEDRRVNDTRIAWFEYGTYFFMAALVVFLLSLGMTLNY